MEVSYSTHSTEWKCHLASRALSFFIYKMEIAFLLYKVTKKIKVKECVHSKYSL